MRWRPVPVGMWAGWVIVVLGTSPMSAAEDPAQKSPFRYGAAGRRDPFVPLILNNRLLGAGDRHSGDSSKPVLRGILWDPRGQSIALIDDLEAKVGDAVREYHVRSITKDEVVLEGEGGQSVVLQIAFETQPSGTTMGGEHP